MVMGLYGMCSQVLTGLRDLREDKQFCDITIKCESQEFLCHKLVLSSFSPYFKAMFSTDMAESNQEKVVSVRNIKVFCTKSASGFL